MQIPKILQSVYGQDRVVAQLWQAYSQNRLPSSFIFSGEEGVGKLFLAKKLSQILLCKQGGCEQCQYCRWIQCDSHPDLKVLTHGSSQGIQTEEVKSFLQELQLQPMYSDYRIGIILHEDGNLNHFGQNALLKTLEEPSAHRILIIITQGVSTLLETIRSRCVILQFQPIPDELIQKKIVEMFPKSNDDTLSTMVLWSQGSFRRAIDFEEKSFQKTFSLLKLWFSDLRNFPPLLSQSIETLSKTREQAKSLISFLLLIARAGYAENPSSSILIKKIWNDLLGYDPCNEQVVNFTGHLLYSLENIEHNYSVRMTFEDLSIKASELFFSKSFSLLDIQHHG